MHICWSICLYTLFLLAPCALALPNYRAAGGPSDSSHLRD
jgi:hypothetical protein